MQGSPDACDRQMPKQGALQQPLNAKVLFPAKAVLGPSEGKSTGAPQDTGVSELLSGKPQNTAGIWQILILISS